jgi:hypothetical protein
MNIHSLIALWNLVVNTFLIDQAGGRVDLCSTVIPSSDLRLDDLDVTVGFQFILVLIKRFSIDLSRGSGVINLKSSQIVFRGDAGCYTTGVKRYEKGPHQSAKRC